MDEQDIKGKQRGNQGKYTVPSIVDVRINELVELILQGVSRFKDFREYSNLKNWNVGDRQLENYINRAKELLEKESEPRRELETSKAIGRYQMLFNKAFKIQDYKTALSVQKSLCELLGLNAPAKTAMTDTEGNSIPTSVTVEIVTTREKATDE